MYILILIDVFITYIVSIDGICEQEGGNDSYAEIATHVSHFCHSPVTSGVVAVIVGGQMFHSWATIPINKPRKENWVESDNSNTQKQRKQNIIGMQFLICDVLMCTKQLKYRGSEIVTWVRAAEGVRMASESFGGMDIIDFGDFHQFPPVGNASAALYCERPETDDIHALKGRLIFTEYNYVVILQEQMRITDDVWMGILSRLRVDECTEDDIKEVQKLVLTNEACEILDFMTAPWCDVHQQKRRSLVCNCRHYILATIMILHLHSVVCIYIIINLIVCRVS